jgi:hypothetical protein
MTHRYTFDVKLFATITVEANSQREARRMIRAELDGASANLGEWPNGQTILCEVSLDDGGAGDLVSIDDEDVDDVHDEPEPEDEPHDHAYNAADRADRYGDRGM